MRSLVSERGDQTGCVRAPGDDSCGRAYCTGRLAGARNLGGHGAWNNGVWAGIVVGRLLVRAAQGVRVAEFRVRLESDRS